MMRSLVFSPRNLLFPLLLVAFCPPRAAGLTVSNLRRGLRGNGPEGVGAGNATAWKGVSSPPGPPRWPMGVPSPALLIAAARKAEAEAEGQAESQYGPGFGIGVPTQGSFPTPTPPPNSTEPEKYEILSTEVDGNPVAMTIKGRWEYYLRRYSVVKLNDQFYAVEFRTPTADEKDLYVELDRKVNGAPGDSFILAAKAFPRQGGYPLFERECRPPRCCAPDCFIDWIGDHMCDPRCNVQTCWYDYGDCDKK